MERENVAPSAVGPGRMAWVPIPVLLFAVLVLGVIDLQADIGPLFLLPVLNLAFCTAVSLVIVALAARSYSRDPSRAVLLLGCGMLAFGFSAAVAGVLVAAGRTNAAVTVCSCGMLLAGLCQLGSALGALAPRQDRRLGHPHPLMVAAPALVVVLLAALTYAAVRGATPVFFGPDGPTVLREEVVVAAASMFGLAAVFFGMLNVQVRSAFVHWYALGLGLIAVGLVSVAVATGIESAAGWLGRGAQYLGGIYILYAAWRGMAEGHSLELPLGPLIETRERYRRLVQVCPDAIIVHTDGRCVFANPAAVRLLGAACAEELVGRQILDLVHPDYRDISAERIRQANAGDAPTALRDLKMLRLDGTPVDVEITGSRVEFAHRPSIQAVVRDVSDRVRAEEALRESERRYRATFEHAAFGIAHAGLDGRYLWVNRRYCEIMGYTADDLLKKTYREITDPRDVARTDELARRLLAGEAASFRLEKRCRRPDGSTVWVQLDVSLQSDCGGQPPHFVSVVQDITERRRAQEELSRNREALRTLNEGLEERVRERTAQVQRLADKLRALATRLSRVELSERKRMARVLHDHIQQLLVAARMQLDAVRRGRNLSRMKALAQNADAILQEAIDASRSVAVDLSPPALHQSGLAGGLRWLAEQMKEKNDFIVHVRVDEGAEPSADELRLLLFECVRELLFNTLKHSGVKAAHVALGRTRQGMARIIVQDEGCGFDVEGLYKRAASDSFFGLFSIQQRLMDCGGELQVEAVPGRGTRVSISVPLGEALPAPTPGDLPEVSDEPVRNGVPTIRDGRIRVLLVDDHKIMREGLAELLRFEPDIEIVGEAADGPQAVNLAEELRPDVITMDVSLPGMNGIEATRAITGKMPDACVIGLSMHLDGGVAEAMRQAGAAAYLTKGGPSEDLLAAIRAGRGA